MTVLAVSPAPSRRKGEVQKQLQAVAYEFGHPFATICDGASELREAVATLKNEEFSGEGWQFHCATAANGTGSPDASGSEAEVSIHESASHRWLVHRHSESFAGV
ncbi:MAG: hypothetical protein ACKOEO_03750 [Planctomycetaceae bacterium]